jgi:universal stress protein E
MVEQALRDAELKHNQTLETLRTHSGIETSHCRNLRGDTLQTLRRFLEADKMDLVVVGSIYRRGFERLLLGSTAESLLLQAPCDVLLVKGGRRTEKTRTSDSVKQQAGHK